MPQNEVSHDRQWRDYRLRMIWFFGAWAGGFVLCGLLMAISAALFPAAADWVTFTAGALWMATFVVTGIRLMLFPCPRCDKAYSTTWLGWWPSGKCRHCGLPRGQ